MTPVHVVLKSLRFCVSSVATPGGSSGRAPTWAFRSSDFHGASLFFRACMKLLQIYRRSNRYKDYEG